MFNCRVRVKHSPPPENKKQGKESSKVCSTTIFSEGLIIRVFFYPFSFSRVKNIKNVILRWIVKRDIRLAAFSTAALGWRFEKVRLWDSEYYYYYYNSNRPAITHHSKAFKSRSTIGNLITARKKPVAVPHKTAFAVVAELHCVGRLLLLDIILLLHFDLYSLLFCSIFVGFGGFHCIFELLHKKLPCLLIFFDY